MKLYQFKIIDRLYPQNMPSFREVRASSRRKAEAKLCDYIEATLDAYGYHCEFPMDYDLVLI